MKLICPHLCDQGGIDYIYVRLISGSWNIVARYDEARRIYKWKDGRVTGPYYCDGPLDHEPLYPDMYVVTEEGIRAADNDFMESLL